MFIDLVGIFGDTPTISSVLDISGHTSVTCCHVSCFGRGSDTLVGLIYGSYRTYSALKKIAKDFYTHVTKRDSGAGEVTCKNAGVSLSSADESPPSMSNAKICVRTQGKL